MEVLDASSRQSGIASLINRDTKTERSHTSGPPNMAAALVSPTSIYTNNGPPPPYTSGWSFPPAQPVSGLISPPDSRRTSDNKEAPPPIQTQRLPSISEALSAGGQNHNPYASPVSASHPSSQNQIPYALGQSTTGPRSYPQEHASHPAQSAPPQPRHPSPPQPIHPQAIPFGRSDSTTASFEQTSRQSSLTSLQAIAAPPNPYPASRYEPQVPRQEPPRFEQDSRAPERANNGYSQYPPQQGSYTYGPPQSMPPTGQHPSFNQSRYQSWDSRDPIEPRKSLIMRDEDKSGAPAFRQGLKRHLDVWDFENNLAQINQSATVLQEWSRHFNSIAQEQQRNTGPPDRMPSLDQMESMFEHQHKIYGALDRMRHSIVEQERVAQDMRMRDHGGKAVDYDDEMSMYSDDMKNQGYGGSDCKKRRGRAAPPGRCHSCNRAETPEWRRGPDGARTLCNACGLHYAKLTRKNTMKQSQGSNGSSLRPKSMDDHSPRPM